MYVCAYTCFKNLHRLCLKLERAHICYNQGPRRPEKVKSSNTEVVPTFSNTFWEISSAGGVILPLSLNTRHNRSERIKTIVLVPITIEFNSISFLTVVDEEGQLIPRTGGQGCLDSQCQLLQGVTQVAQQPR